MEENYKEEKVKFAYFFVKKTHEKSLDDTNWESFDSFQSSRPATQVLIDCRRISADDNIIGLRLGEQFISQNDTDDILRAK